MNNVIRILFFMLLFGVGTGALALAVLCDDFHLYYQQRRLVALAKVQLGTLRELNADYDGLLTHIESEPNAVRRLVPIVLGQRPEEPNALFPEAALSVLMRAKQAVMSHQETRPIPEVPTWLQRIRMRSRRQGLFASGGALVLIAILWFGRDRRPGVRAGAIEAGN